jgi:hypothetical protein
MKSWRAIALAAQQDVWKCSPADGTNAAYERKRIRHAPWQLDIRLHQLLMYAEGGTRIALWPGAEILTSHHER